MTRTLVLGATSTIARSIVRQLGARGHDLTLAARDAKELDAVATDAAIRYGVETTTVPFDAVDEGHVATLEAALKDHPIDAAIACFGRLGDQERARHEAELARGIIQVSLTGLVSTLTPIADHLADRRQGSITVLSSMAGERGRASNYPYGAAKAGVTTFLSGLRQRLHGRGVQVTTIKPGFVDTRMTYGQEGMFLVASPEHVARATIRAIGKGKDVAYVPWFWRPVSWLLRAVPEGVFKRLDL